MSGFYGSSILYQWPTASGMNNGLKQQTRPISHNFSSVGIDVQNVLAFSVASRPLHLECYMGVTDTNIVKLMYSDN